MILDFVTNIYMKFHIPCFFRALTGLSCPGCGITRMILSMLHGHWLAAYQYNRFLFLTWSIIVWIVFRRGQDRILSGCYLVALILWGIGRNLVGI